MALKQTVSNTARSVTERVSRTPQPKVDWEDFNYPPYFRLIHYDEEDLQVPDQRFAVCWAHRSYILTVFLLVLNFLANVVLAAAGVPNSSVHILYSLFNFIIVSIVGGYSFFQAYKGLVKGSSKTTKKGLVAQSAVMLFIFLSCLLGSSNFNGWLNLRRSRHSTAWMVWTMIESSSWMANLVSAGVVFYLVNSSSTQSITWAPDLI
eukprot:CAMPEP_0198198670 /NCGR_PEP_ID=MMETSP1445-20131203/2111_1 /TAXON_ID=36898 /ORGANISM="Pyramimonas sp., Strain CCMP2087" /LENGTH=205 /DNA_ID=CAMNT_0043868299 /DNA_START=318 /DNA_END=935 /DNA_ORIENTATION=+